VSKSASKLIVPRSNLKQRWHDRPSRSTRTAACSKLGLTFHVAVSVSAALVF
jgi:hypothetical protein